MGYCKLQSDAEKNQVKMLIIKSDANQIWKTITDDKIFDSSIISGLSKYKNVFNITYNARLAVEYVVYVILKKTEYPYSIYTNPKVKINYLISNILAYLNLHESVIKQILDKDGSSNNFTVLKKFLVDHSSDNFKLTLMSGKKLLEGLLSLAQNILKVLFPSGSPNDVGKIGFLAGIRAAYSLPKSFKE